MSLREQAAADFKELLEDADDLGTKFILVSIKTKTEFPIAGSFGDIGYLLNPATGEAIQGRTIQAVYSMASLSELTPEEPEKGWGFKTTDLSGKEIKLFVTMYEPDRTLGVARIRLAVNYDK